MRKIVVAIFFLQLSKLVTAQQPSYSKLQLQPEAPKAGQSIVLNYQPDMPGWKKAASIPAAVYIAIGDRIEARDLSFKKNKSSFTTGFTIPDSATLFIVKIGSEKQIDNNDNKGYSFFVMDEKGEPIKSAFRKMSQLYKSEGRSMGINEDEKKASYYFDKCYENGLPANAGYEETLNYYQTKKDTLGLINYLTDLPTKEGINDINYSSAVFYANQYQHKPIGKLLLAYQKLKFPDGIWRTRDIYPLFNAAKTAAAKQALLDSFSATIKGEPQDWQKRVISNINSNISFMHAKEGNFARAEQIADKTAKGTELAEFYNNLAWPAAEKGQNLEEAAVISKKSLDILEKEKTELLEKPAELSTADYLKRISNMEGMFADTYAYIL
ncbi:hypothetical protein, partial [Flavihumibacter sp. CACIAM 22H1]|uniref:hypothetical protein n=1 Tax=Flavihumibacter sp. CACIAM 22H1 TaxID=1812911 RepID=UPI0025BE6809